MGRVRGKAKVLRARAVKERKQNKRAMQGLERLARMTDTEAKLYIENQRRNDWRRY